MLAKNILRYASTSANLYNFLGDTDFEKHIDIYKGAVANALKAHEDAMTFKVDDLIVEDEFKVLDQPKTNPLIYVTFHTGSYNMLSTLLLKLGREVNVLSDTESVKNSDYNELSELYNTKYKNGCKLEMVNVERDGSIFNVLRQIRKGTATVAYLDGNKGIGGQIKNNSNMLSVNFLKGRVKVRKGLAYISYLLKAPIVLVLNYSIDGLNYIKFYQPFLINEGDKETFCIKAIDKIFQHFEEHVMKFPTQWSNWLYVHNWTDLEYFRDDDENNINKNLGPEYSFNSDRFCPLKLESKFYLFDRKNYSMISIDDELKDVFSHKTSIDERQRLISNLNMSNPSLTRDLFIKQVLI
ncbi:hypothetical protein SanaruYs_34810 [Chryseotalea sanaruensis]|uniref:Lipid A biosynthesis acyltransferase n=1 Tax=Chryseotalea sanaruensis TaxID=2482724 RepID=A0A401UEA3_9BACT|nr:hypothetical protein [Chryseotalea sanaruensis]GCC53238.1 hypothetical protein SanaruYs_34810 [Chryseotalea sanaruensis]